MKEKPSPRPGIQQAFTPEKTPVAALLVMTVALSFALLFASGGRIYAASSATTPTLTPPISTSSYTHLVVSLIWPENPDVVSPNTPLSLEALVTTYGPNEAIAKVEFYYTGTSASSPTPLTLLGTTTQANPIGGTYDLSWAAPPSGGDYEVIAKAYDTVGNVATSEALGVWVESGTLIPQPPPQVIVTITSPSNGVYTLPAQISFTVRLDNVLTGGSIGYYVGLAPNAPTTLLAVSDSYSITWVPTQPGLYYLQARFSALDQSETSATIAVQINAPQVSPTPIVRSCKVSYQLESQWAGGFNVNVVLTNTSPVPLNNWQLAFVFPGDQKITQLWNGSYTQTGEQVTITNLSYNGSVAPGGGTVDFGFNGTWASNNARPTAFMLNGMPCSA